MYRGFTEIELLNVSVEVNLNISNCQVQITVNKNPQQVSNNTILNFITRLGK